MLIFMVHKNLIQSVNLPIPLNKNKKIYADTVHFSLVSQLLTILVLSCLTVQDKSTFILQKIIYCT